MNFYMGNYKNKSKDEMILEMSCVECYGYSKKVVVPKNFKESPIYLKKKCPKCHAYLMYTTVDDDFIKEYIKRKNIKREGEIALLEAYGVKFCSICGIEISGCPGGLCDCCWYKKYPGRNFYNSHYDQDKDDYVLNLKEEDDDEYEW